MIEKVEIFKNDGKSGKGANVEKVGVYGWCALANSSICLSLILNKFRTIDQHFVIETPTSTYGVLILPDCKSNGRIQWCEKTQKVLF